MTRFIPLSLFLYSSFLYAYMMVLDADSSQFLTFIWMFVMLAYFLTPVDTTVSLCRKGEYKRFEDLEGDKPYEDA
jgi:hypothetical protein